MGGWRPPIDYLARQVTLSGDKELRVLEQLGLRAGAIVDVGCGSGHFTARLVDRFPAARIIGVDSAPAMVTRAQWFLSGDKRTARVLVGAAHALPLASNSQDAVTARLVFQHLSDPAAVTTEAWRVLKPGGRIFITDIDDDLYALLDRPCPALERARTLMAELQTQRGGDRRIGRSLSRLLASAGFESIEVEAVAISSEGVGIASCFPQLDPEPLDFLVRAGRIDDATRREWTQARADLIASNAHGIIVLLVVAGTKPSGTVPPVG